MNVEVASRRVAVGGAILGVGGFLILLVLFLVIFLIGIVIVTFETSAIGGAVLLLVMAGAVRLLWPHRRR